MTALYVKSGLAEALFQKGPIRRGHPLALHCESRIGQLITNLLQLWVIKTQMVATGLAVPHQKKLDPWHPLPNIDIFYYV